MILNLRDGFSEMRDLLGYQEALMALLLEPRAFSQLLARVVEYNLQLAAVAKQRYGVEILATTTKQQKNGGRELTEKWGDRKMGEGCRLREPHVGILDWSPTMPSDNG